MKPSMFLKLTLAMRLFLFWSEPSSSAKIGVFTAKSRECTHPITNKTCNSEIGSPFHFRDNISDIVVSARYCIFVLRDGCMLTKLLCNCRVRGRAAMPPIFVTLHFPNLLAVNPGLKRVPTTLGYDLAGKTECKFNGRENQAFFVSKMQVDFFVGWAFPFRHAIESQFSMLRYMTLFWTEETKKNFRKKTLPRLTQLSGNTICW